jgi:hypothetical protein
MRNIFIYACNNVIKKYTNELDSNSYVFYGASTCFITKFIFADDACSRHH